MKTCTKCNTAKQTTEFSKDRTKSDGLSTKCKACESVANAAYRAENRDKIAARKAAYYEKNHAICLAKRAAHYAANREREAARMATYRAENSEKIAAGKAAYYAENREKIAAKAREWRMANPERFAANNRKYREANRAQLAERACAYRAANPEKAAEVVRAWKVANPEKVAKANRDWHSANPEKSAESKRNRRARIRNAEGKHTAADVRRIFDNQRGMCANCHAKLFKSGSQKFHVDHVMPLAKGGTNWPSNLQLLCPPCNLSKGSKHPIDFAQSMGKLL